MTRVGLVLYRYITKNRAEIVGNEIFVVTFACPTPGLVNDQHQRFVPTRSIHHNHLRAAAKSFNCL